MPKQIWPNVSGDHVEWTLLMAQFMFMLVIINLRIPYSCYPHQKTHRLSSRCPAMSFVFDILRSGDPQYVAELCIRHFYGLRIVSQMGDMAWNKYVFWRFPQICPIFCFQTVFICYRHFERVKLSSNFTMCLIRKGTPYPMTMYEEPEWEVFQFLFEAPLLQMELL